MTKPIDLCLLTTVLTILSLPLIADTGSTQAIGCTASSQLPCNCSENNVAGGHGELIAPCYKGGIQTRTFVQFALFSAWSWSALNWPVSDDYNGPDYDQSLLTLKGDNSTVWESWKPVDAVFRPDGSAPMPWESRARMLPDSCTRLDVKKIKDQYGANGTTVPDALPPRLLSDYATAEGTVVVDRNGELVRYETVMNKVAFDYIVSNNLYHADGQQTFLEPVNFPDGSRAQGIRGSYWIKAAWKVLGEEDSFDDIHKSWAYVYPVFEKGTMLSGCQFRPVGLIGLHVIYKLKNAPKWAWATFEHTRNAPTWNELPYAQEKQYLLYDSNCDENCAAINSEPKLFPSHGQGPQHSQLIRQQRHGYGFDFSRNTSINIKQINDEWKTRLKDSVWSNYRLKGTQWEDDDQSINPKILANTAIEPYNQSTSSCMDCHRPAAILNQTATGHFVPNAKKSDRIFALQKARPTLIAP